MKFIFLGGIMEIKTYTIYMPRIAAALRKKGFQILKVIPNEKKPQYDAYVFKDCPDFRKAFEEIVK